MWPTDAVKRSGQGATDEVMGAEDSELTNNGQPALAHLEPLGKVYDVNFGTFQASFNQMTKFDPFSGPGERQRAGGLRGSGRASASGAPTG